MGHDSCNDAVPNTHVHPQQQPCLYSVCLHSGTSTDAISQRRSLRRYQHPTVGLNMMPVNGTSTSENGWRPSAMVNQPLLVHGTSCSASVTLEAADLQQKQQQPVALPP